MPEQSAYAILGVPKGVNDKDLKTAYVNLVKKYDPEKHTDRFIIIQNAYDRLRNVKSRAKEDVLTYNVIAGEYLFQPEERCPEERQPDEAEIARVRAKYHENIGDDGARKELCRLLSQRAHYLSVRRQFNEAITDWNEILDIDPYHSRARHNLQLASAALGHTYALHGLHDEAVEMWERALKYNPDNTDLIQNLAISAEKAADPQRTVRYWGESIARWKQKLAQDAENEYLRMLVTEALNHQGDYLEANPAAARFLTTPQPPPMQRISGVVPRPMMGGTAPSPAGPSRTSQSAVPKIPSPQQIPGLRTSSSQVPVAAVAQAAPEPPPPPAPAGFSPVDRYREIVKINPNDFDAHFQLCQKLMEEQLFDEARKELEGLARKHPKNIEVLNQLGWALLSSNQKDAAFACWKRAQTLDPKNPDTRQNLVRAHMMMGKAFRDKGLFTNALVHFKQLLALMPNSAEVFLEIAATYDMKGEVRTAADQYNKVLELDPKNKVARKALNDLRLKR